MASPPFRITLRFGQRLADLSLPSQCHLIQEPHFWAAFEFDPVQIEFLRVVGLKSLETGALLPMSRYRIEDGRLIRVIVEDDAPAVNATILSGIPIQGFDVHGVMFEVITEDVRERLLHRLSDGQRADVQTLWRSIATDGDERVPMEVARVRIRQSQMELGLESVRANPLHARPIQQLVELLNNHEMQIWESLDVRRSGFLTYHDLLLGAVQSDLTFGNINEFDESPSLDRQAANSPLYADQMGNRGLTVATQTSDVSDSSDDDDASQEATPNAFEQIKRQVTPVTIHRKPLFWRQRISHRLMLLHSSPDSTLHALWLKKPNATWLKCDMIPVTDILKVVSGSSKFPAQSDQQSKRLKRRGFSIEIRTPESPDWIHLSVKRSKLRDIWVEALRSFIQHREYSASNYPVNK